MSGYADERLEAAIRAALAESRPETDAPADLRARVELIPDSARPSFLPSPLRTSLLAAARIVALGAAVIGIYVLARLGGSTVPSVSPLPGVGAQPTVFDPEIVGPGVLSSIDHQLTMVPWLVAFLGWVAIAGLAVWVARRLRRFVVPVVAVGLALAILLGLGAASLVRHPGFTWGGGAYGPRLGLDVSAEPPPGSDSRDVWYVTAPKGAPFAFGLTIRNPGPLPIRFLGVVEPNEPGVLFYRWAAAWQHDDPHGFMPLIADSSAFHPIEVAPGDFLTLYVVARASECAFGPGFLDEDPNTFGFQIRETIQIAYSVLGLTATSEFQLPFIVAEPVRDSCPA